MTLLPLLTLHPVLKKDVKEGPIFDETCFLTVAPVAESKNPRMGQFGRIHSGSSGPTCSSRSQTNIPKDCLLPVTAINTELLNVEFG